MEPVIIPAPSHLCILSFVFFESTVEGVGTQTHFFLEPYSCNSAGLPLLIQLSELHPVDSDELDEIKGVNIFEEEFSS